MKILALKAILKKKKENSLFNSLKRSVINCLSVTQNQLHTKHIKESRETKQEKVRTELFRLY